MFMANELTAPASGEGIQSLILTVRGQRVMLDARGRQRVVIEAARHRAVVQRIRPDRRGAANAGGSERHRDGAAVGHVQQARFHAVSPEV